MSDYDFASMSSDDSLTNDQLNSQTGPPKKERSPVVIVLIIVSIIVAVMIIGTIIMAGIVFMWASSFEAENNDVTIENLNIRVEIHTADNTLDIEIISGTWDMAQFTVMVDDVTFTTSTTIASAGQNVIYTNPVWEGQIGQEYNVQIVKDNKIVWEDYVIATP